MLLTSLLHFFLFSFFRAPKELLFVPSMLIQPLVLRQNDQIKDITMTTTEKKKDEILVKGFKRRLVTRVTIVSHGALTQRC
jgi:hypothetical protein